MVEEEEAHRIVPHNPGSATAGQSRIRPTQPITQPAHKWRTVLGHPILHPRNLYANDCDAEAITNFDEVMPWGKIIMKRTRAEKGSAPT